MADQDKTKRDIHGFKVMGDKSSKKGLDYLDYRLSYQEVQVFFNQARYRGKAEFEDHEHRNFTLAYNQDGTYTLSQRKKSGSGWFGWF
ncbi:hypothetical protein ACFL04_00390 [Patescibacteria group bacterium]